MRPTIVLFDVDGTLVTTGGAGRRALERAFEDALEHTPALDFSFAGMTDRAIIRGGLRGSPHEVTDRTFTRVMDSYVEALRDEIARTDPYAVYPGVVDAILALRTVPGVELGLGTGNIERGARIKLDRAELNDHFAFGGFGCDSEDRAELIGAGARRGAERLGRPLEDCRLVIIGDTPRDTAAAHANGGECIAVATGRPSRRELEKSGARWVFDTLEGVSVPDVLGL